jgi:hypothetical protein
MQTRPDIESEVWNCCNDRGGAANCTGGPVETRKEAVACRVDLASAKANELLPDERVMALDQIAPARVA